MNSIEQIIDQVLSADPPVEPSPSFVARVMSSIGHQQSLPPIAVPVWRFSIAALLLIASILAGVLEGVPRDAVIQLPTFLMPLLAATLVCVLAVSLTIEFQRTPRR